MKDFPRIIYEHKDHRIVCLASGDLVVESREGKDWMGVTKWVHSMILPGWMHRLACAYEVDHPHQPASSAEEEK